MPPARIAVLGGGLTGLSSAFHLSRRYPKAEIFLLDREAQLGGWVRSERVKLPISGASVVLEGGPRTLRPNSKSVLELVNLLKLEDKIITVSKSAPPARNRFLYIPKSDTFRFHGLTRLGLSISPLLLFMAGSLLLEPFKRRNREANLQDESFDAFLTRRFNPTFARIFGSALLHGIYASDSRKVSVRAAFPTLWNIEDRGKGSLVRGMLRNSLTPDAPKDTTSTDDEYQLGKVLEMMRDVSVYSFRDGMQTLTKALEDHLQSTPNVSILKNAEVSRLNPLENHSFEISHTGGESLRVTHVASALPLPVLKHILGSGDQTSVSHLTANPITSVNVVNLVFPCPPSQIHPEGFGYLIPRPSEGYSSAPSPGILGVVFDSCSLHDQDIPRTDNYYKESSFTKLTIMTGGPYLSLPLPPHLSSSSSTGIPPFICSLLDKLQIHLRGSSKGPIPNPIYWRIWQNRDCIPTLLPGHLQRIAEMQAGLKGKGQNDYWGGRLAVVGAGVGGVSMGDCVEAGRRVGRDWADVGL
ncbi:protoporphyrinogen oxidase [Pholiota conissans]|uniref:Protoporphyrinogen oxidase n=1 Tax=Pholiota conissans TaxID=109636 RepID=A0A9P6D0T9_9AGAR|nr:protoporphyrinogen oxidase [Pholiota conissans]